jgi:hypothetical protein
MIRRSLRLVVAAGAALAVTSLFAPPSFADEPIHVAFTVDRSFVSPQYSAACGFVVVITEEGTFKGTAFINPAGSVVREVDSQPGATIAIGAPASGKSFAFPVTAILHYQYVAGVTPGSPVVVTATGLSDKVPGIPADAGSVEFPDAVVLVVDTTGFPIVDLGPAQPVHGSSNSLATAITALCTALAP